MMSSGLFLHHLYNSSIEISLFEQHFHHLYYMIRWVSYLPFIWTEQKQEICWNEKRKTKPMKLEHRLWRSFFLRRHCSRSKHIDQLSNRIILTHLENRAATSDEINLYVIAAAFVWNIIVSYFVANFTKMISELAWAILYHLWLPKYL